MTTSTEDTATSDATQDGAPDTTDSTTSSTTETTDQASDSTEPETIDAAYVAKLKADASKARAEAAKYRVEARAGADAKARLADIENANKSEAQRLQDAATAAAKEAADARVEALRWRIAANHGISTDDAELFLTGADEATMTHQAEVLAAKNKVTTPAGTPAATAAPTPAPRPRADLSQGAQGAKSIDPASSFAAFFKGQLES